MASAGLIALAAPAVAGPGTTIDSSPSSPIVVGSSPVDATWSITTPPGTQCQLVDTGSADVVDGPQSCSTGDVTFSIAAPGNYQLQVLPVTNPEADSATLEADPPAPSIDSSPTSPFDDPTPTWSFTVAGGADASCELDHPAGTAIQTVAHCTSPFTADDLNASSTDGDPGDYTLSVTQTVNGTTSAAASSDYDYETAKPATPDVSADQPIGFGRHPSFTVTGLDPDATPTCSVVPAAGVSVVGCGASPSLDLTGSDDGNYTLHVSQTYAGNVSDDGTATYQLDTHTPSTPTISADAGFGSSAAPSFTVGNVDSGATLECSVSGPSTESVSTCDASTVLDLTGGDAGTYTVTVDAKDTAGLAGGSASATYEYLPSAPPAPHVHSADPAGSGTSPQFAVGDSENATLTYQCTVTAQNSDASLTVPAPACGPTTTLDLSNAPDDTYTLSVTATDQLGQVGAVGSDTYTLDTKTPKPVVSLASPGSSPATDTDPSFAIGDSETVDGPDTFRCEWDAPDGSTISDAACSSGDDFPTAGHGNGTYTLTVTAKDAVGNQNTAAPVGYVLEAVAPPAPSVSLIGNQVASSPTASFVVSDAENVPLTYDCAVQGQPAAVVTACGPTTSIDLGSAPDGTYTLQVTVTDELSQTSTPGTADYTLDTVALAPSVALTAPEVSPSTNTSPMFTITDNQVVGGPDGFSCTWSGPGITTPTAQPCASGDTFPATTGDGDYTLSVTSTDAAGNISTTAGTATYSLDTTAPSTPTVVLATPASSPGSLKTPTFTVGNPGDTSPGGLTYTCTVTETSVTPELTLPAGRVTCGPTTTVHLGPTGDGDYTLAVTATDAAGNVGVSAGTASYTLDSTAPAAPTVTLATPATSPGTSLAPTFTVSDSDSSPGGLTYSCTVTETSVTPNVTVPGSDVTCGPTTTVDLGSAGDGSYTLAVTAIDAAGNPSASAGTATYTLDATAPAAPTVTLLSPARSPGNATAPEFGVSNPGDTSPGGLTYSCTVTETSVTPNVAVPGSDITCGPTTTVNLGSTGDGDYTLAVTATDAAGNASSAGAASYTLDTAAPAAPAVTLTSPAGSPGNATSPAFTVSDPDTSPGGVTFACTVTETSVTPHVTVPSADVTCGPTTTVDLAAAGDGDYSLAVTATDAAGNVSATAGTASYTLDTTVPATPVVALSSPVSSPGHSTSPQFTVSDPGDTSPGGLTYTCVATNSSILVPAGDITCGPTTTLNLSALPDDTYTLSVTATDAAGNTSVVAGTASYTLDTAAPAAPTVVLTSPAASPGNDTSPTFTVTDPGDTSPGGLTYSCTATETSTTPALTVPASDIDCGPTATLHLSSFADGDFTLAVTATDAAGNASLTAGTATYILDTTLPTAPSVVLASPSSSPGHSTSPQFTVSDPDASPGGVTYSCSVTGPTTVPGSDVTCGTTTTVDLSGAGRDGAYTLAVTATDAAGNVSATGSATYTLDTAAPNPPAVSLIAPGHTPGNLTSPQFGVSDPGDTSPGGLTYACTVTETSVTPNLTVPGSDVTCGPTTTVDLSSTGDGDYTLAVTATDAAGNVSASAGSASYTLDTTVPSRPTVVLATPASSPGHDTNPTFTVTNPGDVSPGGLTYSCTVTKTSVVPNQTLPAGRVGCGPTTTVNLTGGGRNGDYTLAVVATDAAGNVSLAGSATYTLDTTVPAAPTVVLATPAASPGNDADPTFTVTDPGDTSPGGLTYSCTVTETSVSPNVTVPGSDVTCGPTTTVDLASTGDGAYVVAVVATDAAGNVSLASGSASYTLDATVPAAPTVVLSSPASSPGRNANPTFGVTNPGDASPGGLTYSCTVTETSVTPAVTLPAGRVACGPTTTVHLGPTGDGDYVLAVTATDAAGNVSVSAGSASYTLDTTLPAAPTVVLATPASSPGHDTSPTFTVSNPGDASPGGLTYSCTVTETSVTPNVTVPGSDVTCGATTTVDLGAAADGTYSLAVVATDAAGNVGPAGSASYTLDATAPAAPTVALATPAGSPGHDTDPTFRVTNPGDVSPGGLTYSCTVTETSVTPNVTVPGSDVTCGPTTSMDLTATGDGDYSLAVTATDAAGNTSPSAGTTTYTLDTEVPAAPAVAMTVPAGSPGNLTSPQFSVTDPDSSPGGVTFTCIVTKTSVTPTVTVPGSDVTCGPTTTVDLASTGDGDYTLSVVATDAAGNASPAGTASYTLDATAPAAPTVVLATPASSPGNDTGPTFTVTNPGDVSPGGLTYSCTVTETSVTPNLTVPGSDVTCGPTTSVDLSMTGDGDYSIAVTATDSAGNVSPVGSASYSLDTVAPDEPTVVLATPASSPGHDTDPTFTVTNPGDVSPGGLTYSCTVTETSVSPNVTLPAGRVACGPSTTVHLGATGDGDYTLSVTATDAAGNVSASSGTASYTLDATAPAAPTVALSSPASSPGRSTSPQFAVSDPGDTSPGGITYSCVVTGSSILVPAGDVTCGSTTSVDLSALADDTYTLSVTATDAAGNVSLVGSATYTMDTTVPAAPTVTLATPAGSPGNDTAPTFTVSNPGDTSPGGLTYSCTVTETSVTPNVAVPGSDVTCGPTTTVDLSSAGDGDYTLAVTATDTAGNISVSSGSASYTLDTNVPSAPTIVLATPAGSPGHDTNPTFTVTNPGDVSPGGLTYSCTVTETSVVPNRTLPAGRVSCGPTTTVDLSGGGHDGDYTLAVTATDASGNVSAVGAASYTLDATVPAAPTVVLATPASSPGNDADPTFTVSNPGDVSPGGLTYSCAVTETSVSPNVTVSSSDVTCGPTTTVDLASTGDGDYTLAVVATDAAGNVSLASGSASYTLDTTVPATPTVVLATPASSPGHDTDPTFTVTNPGDVSPGGLTYSCTATETSVTPAVTLPAGRVACGPTTTVHLGPTGDGDYVLAVTATDAAGNVSVSAGSASYTLDTTVPNRPTVVLATPASSPGHDTNPTFTVSNPGDVSPGGLTYSCTVTETSVTPSVTVPGSDVTCGRTTAVDLSSSGDGDYRLAVIATDAAGNVSSAGSATYTLDATAPTTPTVALSNPAGSPGNDTSPAFTVTNPGDVSPGGLTYSCTVTETSVTPNLTVPGSDVACGPTTTVDLSSTGDGDYTLAVTATDLAGNTSPSAGTATYTLDTTAPPAPSIALPPQSTKLPAFGITDGDPSATLSCVFTAPRGRVIFPTGPQTTCPANGTFDTTASSDGDYTLTVTATDPAGNASSTTVTWTRDTTPPPPPTAVAPGSPSNNRNPVFTISDSEAGATLTCQLTGPDSTGLVEFSGTCPASGKLPIAGADGVYTLTVSATDAAGNTNPASATATYTLDTNAPNAPAVNRTAPASSPDNVTTAKFSVSDPDSSPGGITYQCTVTAPGGVTVPSARVTCGPTTTVDLSTTGDADYTLSVTATDAAGNVSAAGTATYTLDTTPPPAPQVTLSTPNSSPGHVVTPAFTVTDADTSPGLTFGCSISAGATPVPSTDITCGASTRVDLSGSGRDGSYTLSVTATDAAGNTSTTSGTATYVLDTTPPEQPIVSLASATKSNTRTPLWTWDFGLSDPTTSEETASCTLSGPGGWTDTVAPCPHQLSPSLDGGDGAYTLTVTLTDEAGNTASAPSLQPYTLDSTAPPGPTVTLKHPGKPAGRDRHPVWQVDAPPNAAAVLCTLLQGGVGGTPIVKQAPCPTPATYSLAGLPDGMYTLKVIAVDAVGNKSYAASASYVLSPAAPQVVAPKGHGPIAVWAVTGNPADRLSCTLLQGSATVVVAHACGPRPRFDMTSRPRGTYTLSVVQIGPQGATSAPGTARWFWRGISTTHPVGPSGPGPGSVSPPPNPPKHPGGPSKAGGLSALLPGVVRQRIHTVEHAAGNLVAPFAAAAHPNRIADAVSSAVQGVVQAVGSAGGGTGFPLLLVGLVVAFVIAQNRIDRRDPKLALASIAADDMVEFQLPPSRRRERP